MNKDQCRPTRELLPCEVVVASLDAESRGTFSAKVSRLLRLGYEPLGHPHYGKDVIMLTMIRMTQADREHAEACKAAAWQHPKTRERTKDE